MSVTSASVRLTVPVIPSANTLPSLGAIFGGIARFFRAQWVYRVTLSRLEGYSERILADMGADRGIEDFARRAAGL